VELKLPIEHAPAAVRPPWGYYDPEAKLTFDSIEAAFAKSDGRLLILGRPGSGKTTALLQLARHLAAEASADTSAPLPFLVNLSKFDLSEKETRPKHPFGRKTTSLPRENRDLLSDWLVREMAKGAARTEHAREWLDEGKVAVLLDGLDEFNDDRRAELAELLNFSFLRKYPDVVVVVCSRIGEYEALQAREETRLQLRSSVRLEPLTPEQIESYLKAADATNLLQALPADEALQELARTPLTLSMLVLAYGGSSPIDTSTSRSLSERRFELFESYVARMLQRAARRAAGIPFDRVKSNDIPIAQYRYRPGQVERWLSWLALTLSVRMRTSFAPEKLLLLLIDKRDPQHERFNYYVQNLVLAIPLALGLGLASTAFELGSLLVLGICVVVAGVLLGPVSSGVDDPSPNAVSLMLVAGSAFIGGVVLLSGELARLLPVAISPIALSLILVSMIVATVFLSDDDNEGYLFVGLAVAQAGLLVALGPGPRIFDVGLWEFGIPVSLFSAAVLRHSDTWLDRGGQLLLILCTAAVLVAVGLWAMTPSPSVRFIGFASVMLTLYAAHLLDAKPADVFIASSTLLIASALVAGVAAVAGPGWCFTTLAVFIVGYAGARRLPDRAATAASTMSRALFLGLESTLLRVGLKLVLFACRKGPLDDARFRAFAVDSFLLKKTSAEYEFVHRLLRDHFALRTLVPSIQVDKSGAINQIRALGYQGESAVDFLIELSKDDDPEVRAAAVWGLGHIPLPVVTQCFQSHVGDKHPSVRIALLESLSRVADTAASDLIVQMDPLHDGSEMSALLDVSGRLGEGVAIDYFLRSGATGVRAMLRVVRDNPVRVRHWLYAMTAALWDLPDSREATRAVICEALLENTHSPVKPVAREATFALAMLGDPRGQRLLERLLERGDKEAREVRARIVRWSPSSSRGARA
jgi:adenylate kinase family enzyme